MPGPVGPEEPGQGTDPERGTGAGPGRRSVPAAEKSSDASGSISAARRLVSWVRRRITPPAGETYPVHRSALSDTSRPWRGSIVAFLGGALIVLVAMTISQGYFNFGVAERGQVIGLIICALALTAVSAPHSAPILGAGIVVAGVVSFPIGLGGLIIGSILSVVGGGLVAARQLAPQGALLRVGPAPAWSRLGAFVIDLILLIALTLFLRGVADDAVGKDNPILFVLPLTIWAVIRAWCGSRYGWTPGRLFVGLRLRDARTGAPPSFRIAFVREVALLIGVVVVGAVVSKGFDLLLGEHG